MGLIIIGVRNLDDEMSLHEQLIRDPSSIDERVPVVYECCMRQMFCMNIGCSSAGYFNQSLTRMSLTVFSQP